MQLRNFLLLICATFLMSCSDSHELSKSASPQDFEGSWVGKWNWSPSETTAITIVGDQLEALRFPLDTAKGISLITAKGEAKFDKEYGSEAAPCVLLFFEDYKEVVPLFITKSKDRLTYTVDITFDKHIVFERTNRSK